MNAYGLDLRATTSLDAFQETVSYVLLKQTNLYSSVSLIMYSMFSFFKLPKLPLYVCIHLLDEKAVIKKFK